MIVDLEDALNNFEKARKVATYRSVLFPAPALEPTSYYCKALVNDSEKHTFTMNPQ